MDIKEIGERICAIRTARNLSQRELANRIGLTHATISRYENGKFDDIKIPIIQSICKTLNISTAYILGISDKVEPYALHEAVMMEDVIPIPVLSVIRAGEPMYAEQHIESYIYTSSLSWGNYFALKVVGDSMNAAGIHDGDTVICKEQESINNNEVAVVLIDKQDATIKRFTRNGNTIVLTPQSDNPKHQPLIYDLTKTDIRVLGKVIKVQCDIV